MHIHFRRQQLKSAMLPVAMIGGAVLYKWMEHVEFLSPYLIFLMLFITYCRLDLKDLRPSKAHILLLAVQMGLSAAIYMLVLPFNHTVAEGLFICVFIPTATAAPVITAMLGGSIAFVASYSLLCNLVVAIAAPIVLAVIGDSELGFIDSMLRILSKVSPLLVLPMIAAWGIRKVSHSAHKWICDRQQLSFYIWAVSLFIIVGSCVSFVIRNWNENEVPAISVMAVGAFVVCLLQFIIGRKIGAKWAGWRAASEMASRDDNSDPRVSCAQSLMQKNTVLGVWLAMTYMTPMASVAPAAYIAWHNLVNSWQIMHHKSKDKI